MKYDILKESFSSAPVNYRETARYAGAKPDDKTLFPLIQSCVDECESLNAVNYCVCYAETPLSIDGNESDFSAFRLKSENLANALKDADSALIFACTVGIGIDRLISKYSQINPSRALILSALGSERAETFTDVFLSEYALKKGVFLTPRFSPGYGDLSLETQKSIFSFLNPQKFINLTLNESLLMSPVKSITAIAGVKKNIRTCVNTEKNCTGCEKKDCAYRR